ncbi:MAG: BatA domain-containing protein [Planctomycetota bacterium]
MFEFFVNPLLLGGLAFATAPIIIHFLNRRRYMIHEWAAMDFLLKASVMNRRRLKLEDLILLLLRCALLALLVFAIARPVLEGFAGFQEDRRVVVVDDSASLELVGPTGVIYDAARESAKNHVQDAFGGSIPVSLRLGTDPDAEAMAIEGLFDSATEESTQPEEKAKKDGSANALEAGSDLLASLAKTEPGDSSLQLARIVERVLDEASADESPLLRSMVLVSDFRAHDWVAENGELRDDLRYAFEEIERREQNDLLRFQFVDVGDENAENVGISDFRIESRHVMAGVPVGLAVEVTNYGTEKRSRIHGAVEVGRGDAATFELAQKIPIPLIDELKPGESKAVTVFHVFEEPGQYPLRATIDGDRLKRDDESFLVAPVREGIRVVIFDVDQQSDRMLRESGFLSAALSPRGDVPSGVVATVSREIRAEALEDIDVAFVLNRELLTKAEVDVLRDFAKEGGGLGFFLGTRVRPDGYLDAAKVPETVESAEASEQRALFPAKLGATVRKSKPGERREMRMLEKAHPIFRFFVGENGLSVEKVPFDRFVELELAEGAEVLAHYSDAKKTPAIVESHYGAGRVMLFNTSGDRDWSDWPTHISYPIVMQEAARYLAPSRQDEKIVRVGEPIYWDVDPGNRYEVLDAAGKRHPIELPEEASPVLSFSDTKKVGFYRVYATPTASVSDGDQEIESTWFACRFDPTESRLQPMEHEKLKSLLGEYKFDFNIGAEVDVDELRRKQEGEIWRYLALVAGVILLLELLVAWWFGRK